MFTVPYGAVDYRVAKGGRGSGKTMTFAKMLCVQVVMMAVAGQSGVALCGREFMNSLDDSTLAEIKAAIASEPDVLEPWFDVGEKYVRTRGLPGRVDFAFVGLRHNIDSLKSKARVLITWIDEAENVSEMAYRKLIPTVMRFGGEIWLTEGQKYKFKIDTATDALLGTYDNVEGINDYSGVTPLVYNATSNGATVNFSLASAPISENTTNIFINGVYQQKNTYSVGGLVVTFSQAPPLNASIEITYF